MDIIPIIGAISGVSSLVVLLYLVGFKLGAYTTKINTMWNWFTARIEETLEVHNRRGHISRSSSEQITAAGLVFIPLSLRHILDSKRSLIKFKNVHDAAIYIINNCDKEPIRDAAVKADMAVEEYISLLAVYYISK